MSEQTKRDSKLVEMLNEAYGKERELEVSLASHLEVTTRDDYEKALRQHLKETKSHASAVAKRIKQLGGRGDGHTAGPGGRYQGSAEHPGCRRQGQGRGAGPSASREGLG